MSLDVYIDGRHAGRLTRNAADEVVFTYLDSYVASGASTPLSLSIPMRHIEHVGVGPNRWIENLLPENEAARTAIANKFGSRATDAYSLLHHIGLDVAGAVQCVPEGQTLARQGALIPWSDARIAAEIDRLHANPADVDLDLEIGRWSLAGQHGKFALARVDGQWVEPTGSQASTHIFKVGMNHRAHSDVAEFVTMRAARSMGLSVPVVDLLDFDGRLAVAVERYDRAALNGDVTRLHQEDFCQALGVGGASKYESDDGPSMRAIAELLRSSVSPAQRDRSIIEFARLQAFNMVAANTDAHGKNGSLLLRGTQVRLAPAYDLISAAFLWTPKSVWFKGKLAMKFGGDYRLRGLDARTTAKAADDLGVDPDGYVAAVSDFASQVGPALDAALDDAAVAGVEPSVVASFRSRAQEWSERVDGACGPAQPGAAAELSTASRRARAYSRALPPQLSLTKREMTVVTECNAYIARTRSRCVLPEGHPGWPHKGHRAGR